MRRISNDNAGKNLPNELMSYCREAGIEIKPSPAYESESNGLVDRLVQEYWKRALVLIFTTELPDTLWAEALFHADWLRNRVPSSRINGDIPILRCNGNVKIYFSTLLKFGQPGFAVIYRSHTTAEKKLLPRYEYWRFFAVEGDCRIICVYIPSAQHIRIVRC